MTTLIPKIDFKNGGATPTGAINRTINQKAQEIVSVKDFGALGNGAADDTTAIQNAINYMTSVGGQLFFPKGYYVVSSTLNVGLPYFNTYDFIVNRTANISDATYTANQNSSNIASNLSLKKIDLIGEAETYLVANFTPSTYQPVIAYNLDQQSANTTGRIENFNIISSTVFASGVYNPSLVSAYATNKLMGIYTGRGATIVSKVTCAYLGVGILSVSSYWCAFREFTAVYCGDGYSFAQANATDISNVTSFTCNRGMVFDGQNGKVSGINTENCNNDLTVLEADACVFGPGYMEDQRTSVASGLYSVILGNAQGTINLSGCTFLNLLTLKAVGNTKKGYRMWSIGNCEFLACRTYLAGIDVDSTPAAVTGSAINCDLDFSSLISSYFVVSYSGDLMMGLGSLKLGTAKLLAGTNSYVAYGNGAGLYSDTNGAAFNLGHSSSSIGGSAYVYFGYNNGGIGSITQNGTTAVAYNTTSDYRLKNNPQALTNSGTFIDALQPKTWSWAQDGSKGVGFLAHEVQTVSANTVTGAKDAVEDIGTIIDSKGKIVHENVIHPSQLQTDETWIKTGTRPVYQSMEYGSAEFVANIVAELQSLRKRVAAVESK